MRISIVILAVLGLVCGKPFQNGTLQDDVNEFIALVPTDKVLEITLDYLHNDKEVQEFVANMQSEEFPKIHKIVEYLKQYKSCVKYIDESVIDIYAIVNEIHDSLGYPPFQPTDNTRTGVSINGLVEDMIAALPLDDMRTLFYKKMEHKEHYKALVTVIQTPEFTNFVDTFQNLKEFQAMRHYLLQRGVDVDHYIERVKEFFGLTLRGMRRPHEDVIDYMALVPTQKILEITLDYLYNDKQVQEIVAYMQSEEFPKIQKIVKYLKEYKNCLNFVDDNGVDVYTMVSEIHDILGYPTFQPTNNTRTGVTINGLIDDMIAVMHLDDMKALFNKKMENNEHYMAMLTLIQTPEFMMFMDTMRTSPEWQELWDRLREMGVNVDHYMELIMEFYRLAWRANRRPQDDQNDVMALFPTHEVFKIALAYLHNDEEVQKFVVYMQSEEFPMIHAIVEYLKEYKDCLKFVNDHGVDVYTMVKEIHDILGYPPLQPTNITRTGTGIHGFINDVFAVVPRDDMKELFYKKMENKKHYMALVTLIQTPEFMKFVDTMQTLPEWKIMRHILQQRGVDLDYYFESIKKVFGLSRRGTRSLHEDVNDLTALVPTDKVLEITLDYLHNDEKVQEFVAYMQSEEFPKIHKIVEYLKQYENCVKYIDDSIIDIYAIVNEIHDSLSYPPFQPTNNTRTFVGIHGLMVDVIAALPRDDMNALVYHKKETSQLYKALDTVIRTPEYTNLMDTVRTLPQWIQMRNILQEWDVDVDHIFELLRALFVRPSL